MSLVGNSRPDDLGFGKWRGTTGVEPPSDPSRRLSPSAVARCCPNRPVSAPPKDNINATVRSDPKSSGTLATESGVVPARNHQREVGFTIAPRRRPLRDHPISGAWLGEELQLDVIRIAEHQHARTIGDLDDWGVGNAAVSKMLFPPPELRAARNPE